MTIAAGRPLGRYGSSIIMMSTHIRIGFAAAAALAWAGTAAQAQTITLRVADALPNGHIAHQFILRPFMEAVTKATNGQVVFQHFPAEQLGKAKDMLALTQTGVADMALTVPSYISDKMPLTAAAELPGAFQTACEAAHAYSRLTREGEILATQEYGANRVRALMSFPIAPSALVVSSARPVAGLKDLDGLKLRTSGGALDLTVRSIGAVPVRMSPPEVYESMQRGTVDGALFPLPSIIAYDLTKLIKTASSTVNFGGIILTYSISEAKWKALTPDMQKVFQAEADRATFEGCKKLDAELESSIKKMEASGTKFFAFSPEDTHKLDEVFDVVRKDWAATLDKRGKPGTPVLAAWQGAVKAVRDNPNQ
jgi:TRAP-type C4-dicarboxylate transport system substrate-binding protein